MSLFYSFNLVYIYIYKYTNARNPLLICLCLRNIYFVFCNRLYNIWETLKLYWDELHELCQCCYNMHAMFSFSSLRRYIFSCLYVTFIQHILLLTALVRKHPSQLHQCKFENIYINPKIQLLGLHNFLQTGLEYNITKAFSDTQTSFIITCRRRWGLI